MLYFLNNNFFILDYFFLLFLDCFDVVELKKNKKYYFNTFSNEKQFKKQHQL
jgi:hypothetical protein